MPRRIYPSALALQRRAAAISRQLQRGRSVLLVGGTQDGKSYFATRTLLPRLRELAMNAMYVKGPMHLWRVRHAKVLIIDEVELRADAASMARRNPADAYALWSENYKRRVRGWMRAMARAQVPSVYIVTRNKPVERAWIAKHVRHAEWDGRPLSVQRFER